MIAIKIYDKNKFIGYFNFETLEYKFTYNKNKKIPKYLDTDFHLKNLRPLKNSIWLFDNEDLYNGVLKSHLNELNELFTKNWYKNYTYELFYFHENKININKHEL